MYQNRLCESSKEKAEITAARKEQEMVPEEGLEPSHTHVRQILSLLRLPFRHSGKKQMERAKGIEPS